MIGECCGHIDTGSVQYLIWLSLAIWAGLLYAGALWLIRRRFTKREQRQV